MIKLVLATSNENKTKEYIDILKKYHIKVISLSSLNIKLPKIKESGKTFKENALIKAKAIAKLTNLPVLADDSGLCISALHNFPGIHSSRFAKENNGFVSANQLLVNKLKNNRKAFFVCSIALVNLFPKPIVIEAKAFGSIVKEYKNDVGFGYDPIFIPNGYRTTYNKLSKNTKNKISHRAKACKKLIDNLLK